MLQRIGFGRYEIIKPPRPALVPAARRAVLARPADDAPVAVRQKVRARPGKRAPTVREAAWMDRIVAHGCIACALDGLPPRPTCVHHILSGGRRLGHLFTLPLCDPGHHQGGEQLGLISRHPWKARFEACYGTELELLATLQARIGFQGATA